MGIFEIRNAVLLSEAGTDRIRQFRDERLDIIQADEINPTAKCAKLVLHVIPMQSITERSLLSMSDIAAQISQLNTRGFGGGTIRPNLDGYLICAPHGKGGRMLAYTQFFRSGIIEGVDSDSLAPLDNGGESVCWIPSTLVENYAVDAVTAFLSFLRRFEIEPPIVVIVSMLGVRGYRMAEPGMRLGNKFVDRDVLKLPELLLEQWPEDVGTEMRPVIDSIWQAAGYHGSPNYGADGKWPPETLIQQ